jgi:ElaB/YqjD/DUF883 family membrane-anchored ribosome-binding protein
MTDYADASTEVKSEVDELRAQIAELTERIKEMASPEAIDEMVHESPYIIAGVALVAGLIIGSVFSSRSAPRERWLR